MQLQTLSFYKHPAMRRRKRRLGFGLNFPAMLDNLIWRQFMQLLRKGTANHRDLTNNMALRNKLQPIGNGTGPFLDMIEGIRQVSLGDTPHPRARHAFHWQTPIEKPVSDPPPSEPPFGDPPPSQPPPSEPPPPPRKPVYPRPPTSVRMR